MEYREDCVIEATHPALPGHFPGNPVVPGVVLLDRVLTALRHGFGDVAVIGLPQVKFVEPLLPAQPFVIVLLRDRPGRVRFDCARAGRTVASGQIQLAEAS